jgi:plasmid stability protein
MPVINIRNVDEGLTREVKAEAARRGVTLRAFVCSVLAAAVGRDGMMAEAGKIAGQGRQKLPAALTNTVQASITGQR